MKPTRRPLRFYSAALAAAALFSATLLAQPGGGPPGGGPPGGGPPGGGAAGDGIWLRNAYFGEAQTFDLCTGHQPGNGQYHYHANPICLRGQLNDNTQIVRKARAGIVYGEKPAPWTHSPILGWAFDGYPVYGPYGYADPTSASSPVKRIQSSFRLRSISARTSLPDWALPQHPGIPQQLTANQYGPAIGGQYPLGRYVEDFEYVAGLGDLDVYNGRFAVTPDFPQGTYAYYITIDANGQAAFPYIVGGQFYGSVTGGTAQAISSAAQDYFVNGAPAAGASTTPSLVTPLFTSWAVHNSAQNAQVIGGYDPAAGPTTTWPKNVPTGVQTNGGVATPTAADTQRIRYTGTTVYVNANGLASHGMGPWYDPGQPGGVFGNFPSNLNYQVQLPRTPAAAATKASVGMGPQGMFVNGVALFNILDGASYSNSSGKDAGGGLVNPTAIHVSAASFEAGPLAQGALVTAFSLFNTTLATSTATANSADWPVTLGGTTVTVTDSAGVQQAAAIYYVSPGQVNYRLPPTAAAGFGSVTITQSGVSSSGNINIAPVYPNLFAQSSDGLAAASITRLSGGQTSPAEVTTAVTASPIDLGPVGDQVYLVLAATGLGATTASSPISATATIGGTNAQVFYAGPQGGWPGLDQVNILLPRSLAGSGQVDIVVNAGGKVSNPVHVLIQ